MDVHLHPPVPGVTGPAGPTPAAPAAKGWFDWLPDWGKQGLKWAFGGLEVAEGLYSVAHFAGWLDREPDGKVRLNKDKIRAQAPHIAKDRIAEAKFSILMQQLSAGERTAIDQYFMPSLCEEQQADFKLSTLEMTYGETEEERQKGTEAALNFLRMIAAITDNDLRIEVADSRDFIKGDPNEYAWVRLRSIANQIWEWTRDPQGFRARWAQLDTFMATTATAPIIEFRNRLGVTIQPVPGAPAPLLPVAPQGRIARMFSAIGNPFSLSRAARRFK